MVLADNPHFKHAFTTIEMVRNGTIVYAVEVVTDLILDRDDPAYNEQDVTNFIADVERWRNSNKAVEKVFIRTGS